MTLFDDLPDMYEVASPPPPPVTQPVDTDRHTPSDGVELAHNVINAMMQIRKNDRHRARAFDMIQEWIDRNR